MRKGCDDPSGGEGCSFTALETALPFHLDGGDSQHSAPLHPQARFSPGSQTEMPPWEKCTPEKGRLVQLLWEQPGNSALCRVLPPQNSPFGP